MTAPSTFGDTNLRTGDFAHPDAGAGDLDRAFLDIRSVHSLAPTSNASPACTRGRSVYRTKDKKSRKGEVSFPKIWKPFPKLLSDLSSLFSPLQAS